MGGNLTVCTVNNHIWPFLLALKLVAPAVTTMQIVTTNRAMAMYERIRALLEYFSEISLFLSLLNAILALSTAINGPTIIVQAFGSDNWGNKTMQQTFFS